MATTVESERAQEALQVRARNIARQLLVGEFPDIAEELRNQRGDNSPSEQDILFGETTIGAFTLSSLGEALRADEVLGKLKPKDRRPFATAITGELKDYPSFKVSSSERIPGIYDTTRNLFYREGFEDTDQAEARIKRFQTARTSLRAKQEAELVAKREKEAEAERLKTPVTIYLLSYFPGDEENEQKVARTIQDLTRALPEGSVQELSFLGAQEQAELEISTLDGGYKQYISRIMAGVVSLAELATIISQTRGLFMVNAQRRAQEAHEAALQIIEAAKTRSRSNADTAQTLIVRVGEPWDLLFNSELTTLTAAIPAITYGEDSSVLERAPYLPFDEEIIRIWSQRFFFSTMQDNHNTLVALSERNNPEGKFGLALYNHPELSKALQQGAESITLDGQAYSRQQVEAILERLLISDRFVMSALAETALFLAVTDDQWRSSASQEQINRIMLTVHILVLDMLPEELITFLTDPRQDQQFMKGPQAEFEEARRLENAAKRKWQDAKKPSPNGRRPSSTQIKELEGLWRNALRATKEKDAALRNRESLYNRRAQETYDRIKERIIAKKAFQVAGNK